MPILKCFHSGALLDRSPVARKPRRKKPCDRFGSHLSGMPHCRECGRKTACRGCVCHACLEAGKGVEE